MPDSTALSPPTSGGSHNHTKRPYDTQNFLTTHKTGILPKPFSIDPPSAGTVTNPSVPETYALSRTNTRFSTSPNRRLQNPNSSALPSSPTPCQFSPNLQMLQPTASPEKISKINALEKQTKDDPSRQKSLLSRQSTEIF